MWGGDNKEINNNNEKMKDESKLSRYEYMLVDPNEMSKNKLLIGGINKNILNGTIEVFYACHGKSKSQPVVWVGLDANQRHVEKRGFEAFKGYAKG